MQKTANQIKSEFELLASGHYQIHSFLYAQEFEQQAYENLIYPLMLVYPLGGNLSGTTYTRNYRVIIADRVLKSEGNELEVESDTQLIALDVLAYWMKLGTNERFSITSSNTITPFWEKWGDEVTGHFVDIGIEEFYDFNSCAIPLSSAIPSPTNPCKDARISVNSVIYGNAPSDSNFNVVVKDQLGALVGSLIGGEWIVNTSGTCADASYTIEDSLGNILYTGTIPSGGTLTQAIGNSTLNVNNSAGTLISSESILAEGTDSYNVADSVAVIKNSANLTLKSENILAEATENIVINDSSVNVNKSDGTLISSVSVKAENTASYNVADSNITNSDSTYDVDVKSTESLVLPDSQINVNGVDEGDVVSVKTIDVNLEDSLGDPVTPTSVGLVGNTLTIEVPSGGGSYDIDTTDRFGNVLPTIIVSADTTLNWRNYDYADFFLSKETDWSTSGYTDAEARTAITNLVDGLITDGIWEKLYCFFPFVGGSAAKHKWNLKNPTTFEQDILYFVGSPTHNELGVVMNGSSNAAYVNANPRQFKTGYEFNFGCYSQGGTSTANLTDIGYYTASNAGIHLSIKYSTSNHRCGIFSAQAVAYTGADTSFFIVNRFGSAYKSIRNTTNLISITSTADGQFALPNTLPLTLGAAINSGLTGYTLHAARTYSGFWFGTGLTDTELVNFNTRVQDFNLELNRQQA